MEPLTITIEPLFDQEHYQPTSLLHQQHHEAGVEFYKRGEYEKAYKEFDAGCRIVRDYIMEEYAKKIRQEKSSKSFVEKYTMLFSQLLCNLHSKRGMFQGYMSTLNSKGISLMKMNEFALASDVYKVSLMYDLSNPKPILRSIESYILSRDFSSVKNTLLICSMMHPTVLSQISEEVFQGYKKGEEEIIDKLGKFNIGEREAFSNVSQNSFDRNLFDQLVLDEIIRDKFTLLNEEEMIRKVTEQADECNHIELKPIGKGKFSLFATHDIKEGESIIVENPFIVASPTPLSNCACCGKILGENCCKVDCPSCNHEKYCSIQCREDAFKKYHHLSCGHDFGNLFEQVKSNGFEPNAACLTGAKLIFSFVKLLVSINEQSFEESLFNVQFFLMLPSGYFNRVTQIGFDDLFGCMVRSTQECSTLDFIPSSVIVLSYARTMK